MTDQRGSKKSVKVDTMFWRRWLRCCAARQIREEEFPTVFILGGKGSDVTELMKPKRRFRIRLGTTDELRQAASKEECEVVLDDGTVAMIDREVFDSIVYLEDENLRNDILKLPSPTIVGRGSHGDLFVRLCRRAAHDNPYDPVLSEAFRRLKVTGEFSVSTLKKGHILGPENSLPAMGFDEKQYRSKDQPQVLPQDVTNNWNILYAKRRTTKAFLMAHKVALKLTQWDKEARLQVARIDKRPVAYSYTLIQKIIERVDRPDAFKLSKYVVTVGF